MTTPLSSPVRIYGAPMDLGQSRRGVDMGPSAIRYAGLDSRLERLGLTVRDGGNIRVPNVEEIRHLAQISNAHNAQAIAEVCTDIHQAMCRAVEAGERVIFLGGDHSMALGTISGALTRAGSVGVLWVDTHGDFNTPDISPSGNVHGMVLAALMGRCPPPLRVGAKVLQPDQVVLVGVRDLDVEEKRALRDVGVRVMTMRDVDENGMADVMRAALRALGNVDAIHVSFDMDVLDPMTAPGVGTAVPGGLTIREAHLIMEMLADDGRVQSLDLVEVNPILDERNRTALLAVELAAGLFGQRII